MILFTIFGLPVTGYVTTMWAVMLFLLVVCLLVSCRLQKVPGRLQCLAEYSLGGMMNYFGGMMGKDKARKYFPLIMTLFLFILFSNWSGILPGAGHFKGFRPPTTTLSVPAALAIIYFVSAQVIGIKEKGLGFYKHLLQPFFFLLPINLMDDLVRPLSLSLRLYGNTYGEETVVAVLFSMVPYFVPIPIQLLGILFGFIQALVFTTLVAIFIGQGLGEH